MVAQPTALGWVGVFKNKFENMFSTFENSIFKLYQNEEYELVI